MLSSGTPLPVSPVPLLSLPKVNQRCLLLTEDGARAPRAAAAPLALRLLLAFHQLGRKRGHRAERRIQGSVQALRQFLFVRDQICKEKHKLEKRTPGKKQAVNARPKRCLASEPFEGTTLGILGALPLVSLRGLFSLPRCPDGDVVPHRLWVLKTESPMDYCQTFVPCPSANECSGAGLYLQVRTRPKCQVIQKLFSL